ncbi:MAG: hypothetical protein ACRETZ_19315, partial [Steroidobacteraceae bacterium]
MRRPFGPLAVLLFAFLGLWLLSGSVHAQTSLSSGGMGSLFQGLTPEEQQAILGRLGAGNLGGGTSTLTQLPGQLGSMGALSQSPQMQEYQQEMAVRRLRAEQEQQPLIPVLKGGDWVIIQIGFNLPPPPVNPSVQALQRLYSTQGGAPSSQSLQALEALQGSTSGNASALAGAATGATPPASKLTPAEKIRLTALRDLIRSRNPYQLAPDGVLTL